MAERYIWDVEVASSNLVTPIFYFHSLELAKEHDIHSIAFPAISTGAYGYPVKEAVCVAIQAISDWMAEHKDYEIEIIICCFDRDTYDEYDCVMSEA